MPEDFLYIIKLKKNADAHERKNNFQALMLESGTKTLISGSKQYTHRTIKH